MLLLLQPEMWFRLEFKLSISNLEISTLYSKVCHRSRVTGEDKAIAAIEGGALLQFAERYQFELTSLNSWQFRAAGAQSVI